MAHLDINGFPLAESETFDENSPINSNNSSNSTNLNNPTSTSQKTIDEIVNSLDVGKLVELLSVHTSVPCVEVDGVFIPAMTIKTALQSKHPKESITINFGEETVELNYYKDMPTVPVNYDIELHLSASTNKLWDSERLKAKFYGSLYRCTGTYRRCIKAIIGSNLKEVFDGLFTNMTMDMKKHPDDIEYGIPDTNNDEETEMK